MPRLPALKEPAPRDSWDAIAALMTAAPLSWQPTVTLDHAWEGVGPGGLGNIHASLELPSFDTAASLAVLVELPCSSAGHWQAAEAVREELRHFFTGRGFTSEPELASRHARGPAVADHFSKDYGAAVSEALYEDLAAVHAFLSRLQGKRRGRT